VEVTCGLEDEVWKDPASLSQRVIDDLIKAKLIDSQKDVLCIHPERLENAYPIYKTNYRKELKQNIDNLYKIKNLILAGRTGLFWYNNMDHSIENAFQVAESIQNGQRERKIIEFWE
jgi:protoporphyrinogen oxidase